ncbi:hypothetical protein HYN51_04650 [Limnobaculum parvum]|uniref:Uncharacterized protein n=1 Tax=Limnobaculum parvum TaxID=2172103 RepID=A0A2Y9TWN1_9GAMM|nr:hypothetical protein HYN51_04650 [Limnobaculum parvum]
MSVQDKGIAAELMVMLPVKDDNAESYQAIIVTQWRDTGTIADNGERGNACAFGIQADLSMGAGDQMTQREPVFLNDIV